MGLGHMEQALMRVIKGTRGSFISPKIRVQLFPSMGLGIQATERIDAGEVVFIASNEIWNDYSALTARQEALIQAPGFVERVDAYCGRNQRMADAVLLATHIVLDDTNDVYLNSLPQILDVPMYWPQRRLDELRHCEVLGTIENARDFYRKMHTDIFGITPILSGIEFQWALSILMSRATSGKNQPFTLIPFFEWFNHSSSPSACTHEYVENDNSFVIRTTKTHEPNEQLFINYGNHSHGTYLRHYGFASIEQATTLDPVPLHEEISFLDISPSDPSRAMKLELLNSLGWPDKKSTPFTVQLQSNDMQSFEWDWLRVYVATIDELQHRQQHPNNVSWLDSNTNRVKELLTTICTTRLSKYATSTEHDFTLLNKKSASLEPWHASCVNIRLGEKLALHSFIDRLGIKSG